MEALSNFVPGNKYLRENGLTALGLNIEGECILDSNCVAIPLANHDQNQPLPANCSRYAKNHIQISSLNLTGLSHK